MSGVSSSFEVGDRVPNFALPGPDGLQRIFVFETNGRPILLVIGMPSDALNKVLAELNAAQTRLDDIGCQTMAVVGGDLSTGPGVSVTFVDQQREIVQHLLKPGPPVPPAITATTPELVVMALDENQRVLGIYLDGHVALDRLAAYRADSAAAPSIVRQGAPVLMMERLLTPELCREMISAWQTDNAEGSVSTGLQNVPDPSVKKNREHVVRDQAMIKHLAGQLGRRIAPELEKVFNHRQPSRFEAFMVLSYNADRQDFFGPHRDNLRAQQKRRFAMSLNLNDDFDGGELVFPEYGPHRYLPPPGGAAIFSCSLLHEALPVTRGQRWVMTTFFCDQ